MKPVKAQVAGLHNLRAALAVLVALVLLSAGVYLATQSVEEDELPVAPPTEIRQLALFGTIPIYWGEAAAISDLLDDRSEPHWARAELEKQFELSPIDALDDEGLAEYDLALMAQPRALAAEENVALDRWVRKGGVLLMFADPMLTSHSEFAIGDKRRPQDVALLSPILARWGLELEYDPEAHDEVKVVSGIGDGIPTRLAGRFRIRDEEKGPATACVLKADRLVAKCEIGRGKALIVADAAVFDEADHAGALVSLTAATFGPP